MIRSHHILQHSQAITFLRLIQPLQPTFSILGKLKKKLSLMASMSDMPHLVWDMITIRSWHKPHLRPLKQLFHHKKEASKHLFTLKIDLKSLYINHLAWCDPVPHIFPHISNAPGSFSTPILTPIVAPIVALIAFCTDPSHKITLLTLSAMLTILKR